MQGDSPPLTVRGLMQDDSPSLIVRGLMQDDSPSLIVRGLMQGDSPPLSSAKLNALRLGFISNLNYFYRRRRMARLKFYDIDENYINYLKTFDRQVPNVHYNKFNKFFCGIVLQVGQYDYFAPITSLTKQQRTNFLIYDKGRAISSIRFSFMIPAFPEVLILKDFNKQPQSYRDLLNAEIKYCNQSVDKIYKKAKQVYKIGTNRNHPLSYTCCDFNLLEQKSVGYLSEIARNQVASTNQDQTP
jgi:protein AbiQ